MLPTELTIEPTIYQKDGAPFWFYIVDPATGDHVASVWRTTPELARFLAAAPAMLEALNRTMKYLEQRADNDSNHLWAEVTAAIAQATGTTENNLAELSDNRRAT